MRGVVNDEAVTSVVPDTIPPRRGWADVEADVREALKPENMEHLDSSKQAGGGHPGHLAGGAEVMWALNSQLLDAIKRFDADTGWMVRRIQELEVLLSAPKPCRFCGESS